MTQERFEIWSDPDIGDWTVSEHFEDGSEDIVVDTLASRAEAERWVRNILWIESIDRLSEACES